MSCVLVVDDEPITRMLLRQLLEREDHRVIKADTGEESLHLLRCEVVDVVLLDIALPGVDGCTICSRIRDEVSSPPPVLMITGPADEEAVERAFLAGAVDYSRKPLYWPVPKNRLRSILAARQTSAGQAEAAP
ncbi:MAG: hypothetical protein BWK76_02905 [Desulfobulbaceae bacterium A2]|nr:MAG: hypothetical protein BWK76_02905 [Desulfobulbaceae bacterium A2]